MDLLILDTEFNALYVADTFESLLWTERYSSSGDFELYTPMDTELMTNLKLDHYIWIKESDRVMIVEEIEGTTEPDSGTHLIVTGSSLESILNRRILLAEYNFSGSLQNGIKTLLTQNFITPIDSARQMPNLVFVDSVDPRVTSATISTAIQCAKGESIGDIIVKVCDMVEVGYKITLGDDDKFYFTLYTGVDRSYDQMANPYTIFSQKFQNLSNSNHKESGKNYKTVAIVANSNATQTISKGPSTGLRRREVFVGAGDSDTAAMMTQKGNEILTESSIEKTFDGEIETTSSFKFGDVLYLGDIVQIEDESGLTAKTRIVEIIRSQNTSATLVYPTFKRLD